MKIHVEWGDFVSPNSGETFATDRGGIDTRQYVAAGAFTGNEGLPSSIESLAGFDSFVAALADKTTEISHVGVQLGASLYSEHTYFFGGDGDDSLSGSGTGSGVPGTVDLWGGRGDDTLIGGAADDTLAPGSGNDVVDGGKGTNTLSYLGAKSGVTVNLTEIVQDTGVGTQTISNISNLVGSGHNDLLTGDASANQIDGVAGKDTIIGGGGADTLIGGGGKDHFVFATSASADGVHISDLENRDVIDLSGIDANANRSGNQRFHLIGAFDGHAQELMVHYDGTNTTIQGDTNGDGVADFTITATGDHHDYSHFVL